MRHRPRPSRPGSGLTVAVVYPLNHKARPNQCAIDVEWGTVGLRYEGLPNIFVTSIKESLKGKNP